jgi:hypothetical protein
MPITAIVLLLNFTLTPLMPSVLWGFFFGVLLILAGLSVFLLGVDVGVSAVGRYVGAAITRTNKIWIVAVAGVVLGFFITLAEPDLHILGGQVEAATSGLLSQFTIVLTVSVGIAVLLAFGLIRIVYNVPLFIVLTALYGIIFVLSFFTAPEFMAISFDASGATTGAMTVPFILALALGVSAMKKDSKSSEKDSFGLVAIASAGAVIAMMVMSILAGPEAAGLSQSAGDAAGGAGFYFGEVGTITKEVFFALLPLVLIFLVFQAVSLRLPAKTFRRVLVGLAYTFGGLVLFLVGINAGFMDVGETVGFALARMDNKIFLMIVGFALGVATILAEPAVYILTRQIEDVTSGYVRRQIVLPVLAAGVGLAVLLSTLRILIPGIQLWHYLLPGYAACIVMSYFVPKLFVGMAFDSGGVASGPMTATFILAFAQGAAQATEGADILADGFGMIATVALMPIIALQILGAVYKRKAGKEEIKSNG